MWYRPDLSFSAGARTNFKIDCNDQSAVKVLLGEKYLDKTKHEMVKIEYVWDLIHDRILVMEWIGTQDMVADGPNKSLGCNKFEKFVQQVGLSLCAQGDPGFREYFAINL